MVDETPEQLQRMIDLLETIRTNYFNVIYDSVNMWADGVDFYPDGTTSEWKSHTRYQQANDYIQWMEERGKHLMDAQVVKWEDAKLEKGTKVLVQGAIMKFIKDIPDKSDEDTRYMEVEYRGMEMEMAFFRHYYTAVLTDGV